MNNLTKQLIGAAIGGAIGYFVADVVVEYIRFREEPYEDEPWLDGTENDPIPAEKQLDPKEPAIVMGHKADAKKVGRVKSYTEYFKSQGREDIAALIEKYSTDDVKLAAELVEKQLEEIDDEDDEDMGDLVIDEVLENQLMDDDEEDADDDPCIISMEEYAGDEGHTKRTLNYYDNDVLTDEKDIPIANPENFLGDDALTSFGELSHDEDVVYVRNEAKNAMYEIVRLHKEFGVRARRTTPLSRRPRSEEDDGENND